MGTSRGAISTVGLPVWLITFSLCVPVLSCGDPAGPGEALVDTAPVKEGATTWFRCRTSRPYGGAARASSSSSVRPVR